MLQLNEAGCERGAGSRRLLHLAMDIPRQHWPTRDGTYMKKVMPSFVRGFSKRWDGRKDVSQLAVGSSDIRFCCPTPLEAIGQNWRDAAMTAALRATGVNSSSSSSSSSSSTTTNHRHAARLTLLRVAGLYASRFDAHHETRLKGPKSNGARVPALLQATPGLARLLDADTSVAADELRKKLRPLLHDDAVAGDVAEWSLARRKMPTAADCTHVCLSAPDIDLPFLDALTTAVHDAVRNA